MKDEPQLSRSSFWRTKLIELFGIDLRTLALFRMATALVLFYDLIGRFVDVRAMYSEEGVMPLATLEQLPMAENAPWIWSLNFLNDSVGFQSAIFVVALIFAFALLVGFATRLATIGSWILVASIHARGSMLLINGGDLLLVLMLFWGMFLPLGRKWSLDTIFWKRNPKSQAPFVSIASAAIMMQVCFMYFFSAIYKSNEIWFSGEALGKALSYEIFVRPLGRSLLNYPGLLNAITHATLWLEIIGPFLFFFPWKTAYVRLVLVPIFMSLHLGIEMTMTVALFSCMSIAALTLFLPPRMWDWILRRKKDYGENSSSTVYVPKNTAASWTLWGVREAFCLFMLMFIILWNINTVFPLSKSANGAPRWMLCIANVTSVNQVWNMFGAPDGNDPWYVAVAYLQDGSKVDVLREGKSVVESKPNQLHSRFRNHRWKMIYTMLSSRMMSNRFGTAYRNGLADYLRRQWNNQHGPEQQIVVLHLRCYSEIPPADLKEYPVTLASSGVIGEGKLQNGERHGHWILRDQQGNKSGEGRYVHGSQEGLWTYWHPNNRKHFEGPYEKNRKDGKFTFWTVDGRKEGEGRFRLGKEHGKWTFWEEDGSSWEANFSDGEPVQ